MPNVEEYEMSRNFADVSQKITVLTTELKNDCACVTCDPVGGKISTQATNS